MQLIPIRRKYVYKKLEKIDTSDGRVYKIEENEHVPSVTTILDATKDKVFLKEWEERIGVDKAEQIKNDAATVGTHMHNAVERLLLNRPLPPPRTWLAVKGYRMGYALVEHFFPDVEEVWGSEVPLYYPGLYAGTTDFVGVYKGMPAILDYKQTVRMKKRAWIDDYFIQLAAYIAAHNAVHGEVLTHGVILMVAQTGEVEEFVTCGRELEGYHDQWMRKVDQYYEQKKRPEDNSGLEATG
jgi:genome maintenance exonuclease 1